MESSVASAYTIESNPYSVSPPSTVVSPSPPKPRKERLRKAGKLNSVTTNNYIWSAKRNELDKISDENFIQSDADESFNEFASKGDSEPENVCSTKHVKANSDKSVSEDDLSNFSMDEDSELNLFLKKGK